MHGIGVGLKMNYRSTIKTSLEILAVIAENGEYAQYDMPKAVNKDYHTVLRHLQTLEQHELITLARTQPAEKHGKDKKIYTLTLKGLVELLTYTFQGWKSKDSEVFSLSEEAVENFKGMLPLVLGKWEFFKRKGIQAIISDRFLGYFRSQPPLFLETAWRLEEAEMQIKKQIPKGEVKDEIGFLKMLYSPEEAEKEYKEMVDIEKEIFEAGKEMLEHSINLHVFLGFVKDPLSEIERQQCSRFLSILSMDRDLKVFINSELKNIEKKCERQLQIVQSFMKTLTAKA